MDRRNQSAASVGLIAGVLAMVFGIAFGAIDYRVVETSNGRELQINPEQPFLEGHVSLPSSSENVELSLIPGPLRWRASIDEATGRWHSWIPAMLKPGSYKLYVNSQFANDIVVGFDPASTITSVEADFRDGSMNLALAMISGEDETLRAWVVLSEQGEADPWANPAWLSSADWATVEAGVPVRFAWEEEPIVPPGTYQISVWINRLSRGAWEHFAGGTLDLPSVTVDTLDMLGDSETQSPTAELIENPMVPGTSWSISPRDLTISNLDECDFVWRLVISPRGRPIISGSSPEACQTLDINVPESLKPGEYLLEIEFDRAGAAPAIMVYTVPVIAAS